MKIEFVRANNHSPFEAAKGTHDMKRRHTLIATIALAALTMLAALAPRAGAQTAGAADASVIPVKTGIQMDSRFRGNDRKDARKYAEWIRTESARNRLERQTINVKGGVLRLDRFMRGVTAVQVTRQGAVLAEAPVISGPGLTAQDLMAEGFDAASAAEANAPAPVEFILTNGDYEVRPVFGGGARGGAVGANNYSPVRVADAGDVGTMDAGVGAPLVGARNDGTDARAGTRPAPTGEPTDPAGEGQRKYAEDFVEFVTIGETEMFFIALGDGEVGYTFSDADLEIVADNDRFMEGLWVEGKLSYYLRGKILGKYLITSSLDSQRDQKKLFTNLDPDKYYPVYGDESSVDYTAADTQGILYLMVEWDKSSITWGDYAATFADTEFAQFSRTLYGGKVHYESVSSTKFGEPHLKIIVFKALAKQKPSHDEFLGTGGSLFYLKHTNVTEGSEKIKIEVRDKITGLVIASEEMKEGSDYQIKYPQGRIVFWQPVSFITETSTIISDKLLNGNPVYVIADYEYDVKDKYSEGVYGGRAHIMIGDYLGGGATYVKEDKETQDYELRGADATFRLNDDIAFGAEYAASEAEGTGSYVSTDGGLTFTELPTDEDTRGEAYGVKGEAHLFGTIGLYGYYKSIGYGFSSPGTEAQQGKELKGFAGTWDLWRGTRLTVAHDVQTLLDGGNAEVQAQVGAIETRTSTVQGVSQLGALTLTGEYRHQEVDSKIDEFETETNTAEDVVAGRVDIALTEKIGVYGEYQANLTGPADQRGTVGIVAAIMDRVQLRGDVTSGTPGTAANAGIDFAATEDVTLSADYTVTRDAITGLGDRTTALSADVRTGALSAEAAREAMRREGDGNSPVILSPGGAKNLDPSASPQDDSLGAASPQDDSKVAGGAGGGAAGGGAAATTDADKAAGTMHVTYAMTESALGAVTRSTVFGTSKTLADGTVITADRTFATSGDRVTSGERFTVDAAGAAVEGVSAAGARWAGTFAREHSENRLGDEQTRSATFGLTRSSGDAAAVVAAAADGVEVAGDAGGFEALGVSYTTADTDNFTTGARARSSTFGLVREADGARVEGTFSRQHSESADSISNTNMFGLTGNIDDKWAANAQFERGEVQNLDGTRIMRNAASAGIGYVNKDPETGDILFQASAKAEARYDLGAEDTNQFVLYTAGQGMLNPDTTLFFKADTSQSRNVTTGTTIARYRVLSTGIAYRPIYFDKLNFLARYTYMSDDFPAEQEDYEDLEQSRSHVIAAEGVYDINEQWQLTEKVGIKMLEEKVTGFDFTNTQTWLWINRVGYKIDDDWQIIAEYRILTQVQAKDYKQGALFEIVRNIGDFIQLTAGYNLTDFNDDLTDLSYTAHGPYIRVTGRFYDRTPEEIARSEQRRLEAKIVMWAWQLVNTELGRPDSSIMQGITECYYLAQKAGDEGDLLRAKELYEKIASIGIIMYTEAEQYVRDRLALEKQLKADNELAARYYKEGKLDEAKVIWEGMVEDSAPAPVTVKLDA